MTAITGTNHNWEYGSTLQWGAHGAPWESAQTVYHCIDCGVEFIHYYHNLPDIYEAMRYAGIPEECKHA